MAALAASHAATGMAKSGWPIARLIGSSSRAARSNAFRIPEESKALARRETIVRRTVAGVFTWRP